LTKRNPLSPNEIQHFILEHVGDHPRDIASLAAKHFGITRQALSRHLQALTAKNLLLAAGSTRGRSYKLAPLVKRRWEYPITPALAEDQSWARDVRPLLQHHPKNVVDIWHFGFTEMFNNAIDHSGGSRIVVQIEQTAIATSVGLMDDGIGIFKKIQTALNLLDERHAVLELSKGKLTTDPAHHSGQGIFFTSRLLDQFAIFSGGVSFIHTRVAGEGWIWENPGTSPGTHVFMKLDNSSTRIDSDVFAEYSSGDNCDFTKTGIPVRLAQFDDKLVSRSQAKRVLARVDLFKTVMFDFAGVETIGQPFADEIFRVFARSHRHIELFAVNTTPQVARAIEAAKAYNLPDTFKGPDEPGPQGS